MTRAGCGWVWGAHPSAMEGPHRALTSSHGQGGLRGTLGLRLLCDAAGEPRAAATSPPWAAADGAAGTAPLPAGRSAPVLGGTGTF